jgi:hypothetical protein
MTNYAQLDQNNVVVFVIHAKSDGKEDEFTADTGHVWKQTSDTGEFRFNFAGIGHTYDETRDAFIPPTPYSSWVLDEGTCTWVAPVPKPDGDYVWDEPAGDWVEA